MCSDRTVNVLRHGNCRWKPAFQSASRFVRRAYLQHRALMTRWLLTLWPCALRVVRFQHQFRGGPDTGATSNHRTCVLLASGTNLRLRGFGHILNGFTARAMRDFSECHLLRVGEQIEKMIGIDPQLILTFE